MKQPQASNTQPLDVNDVEDEAVAELVVKPQHSTDSSHNDKDNSNTSRRYEVLRRHAKVFAAVAVLQTFLTTGIIFGWASILPLLRKEEYQQHDTDAAREVFLSSSHVEEYAAIFMHATVALYLSRVPFGYLVDRCGPRICALTANTFFAVGLLFLSASSPVSSGSSDSDFRSSARIARRDTPLFYWDIGFTCLGFAGPGIQLSVLHLARLFHKADITRNKGSDTGNTNKKTDGSGAALFMSLQAAAFDGGSAVFAMFALMARMYGWTVKFMFRLYLVIPLYQIIIALLYWPDTIPSSEHGEEEEEEEEEANEGYEAGEKQQPRQFRHRRRSSSSDIDIFRHYSSYQNPSSELAMEICDGNAIRDTVLYQSRSRRGSSNVGVGVVAIDTSLADAPLSTILMKPYLYCLSIWVAIHTLKLNFFVATINDQLSSVYDEEQDAQWLIDIFSAMLPCGFIALPLVAAMLTTSPKLSFHVANVIGVLYGYVITFALDRTWLLIFIVFPVFAISRQMVYSTMFHQTGELFGFRNYGVLLGLNNVITCLFNALQDPLTRWATASSAFDRPFRGAGVSGDNYYFWPNLALLLATAPLFGVVQWMIPRTIMAMRRQYQGQEKSSRNMRVSFSGAMSDGTPRTTKK